MSMLKYPTYLDSPGYENRTFTINVLESKTLGDDVGEVLSKVVDKAKQVYKGGRSSDSLSTIIAKKEENYKRLLESSTEYTIVLPLPNSFTDSQSHGWETSKGIMGSMGENLMNQTASSIVGDSLSKLPGGKAVGGLARYANDMTGAGNITVNQALGALASEANVRKPMIDPGYFQNYNGSEPRTFSFEFDLVPESAEEAVTIQKIILKLKEYASPELTPGGVSLLAPRYFDIIIGNEYISGVANLHSVVLRNISINYGADGSMQFFEDGTPKYIKMSLEFAERTMLVADYFR